MLASCRGSSKGITQGKAKDLTTFVNDFYCPGKYWNIRLTIDKYITAKTFTYTPHGTHDREPLNGRDYSIPQGAPPCLARFIQRWDAYTAFDTATTTQLTKGMRKLSYEMECYRLWDSLLAI